MRPLSAACILLICAGFAFADDAAAPAPPKDARSVHLWWKGPHEVQSFYNQVQVQQTQLGSYFQLCGFNDGYAGIQQLTNGKKVVIFSVWDKADKDGHVAPEDKTVALFTNPDVKANNFGGEGTGLHILYPFDWDLSKTYCILVRATPDGDKTKYAGYFRPADSDTWIHLATYERPTGGIGMKGLYSFIEDFRRDGKNAQQTRRALFGHVWLQDMDGHWSRSTKVSFTATGKSDTPQRTIDAGVFNDWFYLQTGGDTVQHAKVSDTFECPDTSPGDPPKLPPADDN